MGEDGLHRCSLLTPTTLAFREAVGDNRSTFHQPGELAEVAKKSVPLQLPQHIHVDLLVCAQGNGNAVMNGV